MRARLVGWTPVFVGWGPVYNNRMGSDATVGLVSSLAIRVSLVAVAFVIAVLIFLCFTKSERP